VGLGLVLVDLANHDRAFDARIFGDPADRRASTPEHNVDAGLDVRIIVLELADCGLGAQQGHAAAPNDAFFARCPRRR
jgi:hypothetical protein